MISYLEGLPEWYITEREAERIIKKLTSTKELTYYLENPDEHIRRLAIIRHNELGLKDSVIILKEILEDSSESLLNKKLAAWTIKGIGHKWNTDIFWNNILLNMYSGRETYSTLFNITINNINNDINYEFSSDLLSLVSTTNSNSTKIYDEISIDIPFPLQEWIKTSSLSIMKILIKAIFQGPAKILQVLYKAIRYAIIALLSVPGRFASEVRHAFKRKAKQKTVNTQYYYKKSINLYSLIKSALIQVLRIIFFPLRLVLKHKKAIIVSIAIVYCLITFTTSGKLMAFRYFGVDILYMQNYIYTSTKEILSYAWNEIRDVTGLNIKIIKQNAPEDYINTLSNDYDYYIVTAKSGLNLRKEPDASSEKAIDEAIEFNSTVIYLSKSHTDSNGGLWYYIRINDGTTGWVYSKWLAKVGDI